MYQTYRRKHDAEKSGGQDTSLLNPVCNGKGYRAFSVILHPRMHAVMKLSNDGDEFSGQPYFAMILERPFLLCQMPKLSGSQCFVPDTSLTANTVNSPTFLTEATLTLWFMFKMVVEVI